MEKNLCSFRDNASGECGADPRDSTNKCEVVKLQSCLKEILNLWHCRQIDAECNGMKLIVYERRVPIVTSQQISGFFSRLSTQELHRREIRAHVQDEVCISHPICYDQYNICELVQKSKLSHSVHSKMLQKICETFHITHVTEKRKAPYIAKLVELVRGCSCQTE